MIDAPRIGWVLRYQYAWRINKTRPDAETDLIDGQAAMILFSTREGQRLKVRVAPIIENAPQNIDDVIEIPPATRRRLGLRDTEAWIPIGCTNDFFWPKSRKRPLQRSAPATIYLGPMPPVVFRRVRRALLVRANPTV